jgi:hypothetical protein
MLEFIKDRPILFSVLGGVLILIIVGIILIVKFVDAPLKEGAITNLQHEELRVYYEQHRREVERTETYPAIVTHTRSVPNGNGGTRTETYTTTEIRTRHVFDHWLYIVYKVIDNEDYVVTISAPSKKIKDKTLTAKFYVTKETFENGFGRGDGWFKIDRKRGDRRLDFNNESIEMERQHYVPIDMKKYPNVAENSW